MQKEQSISINYGLLRPNKGEIWLLSTLVDNFPYQKVKFKNFFEKKGGKMSIFRQFPGLGHLQLLMKF